MSDDETSTAHDCVAHLLRALTDTREDRDTYRDIATCALHLLHAQTLKVERLTATLLILYDRLGRR